MFDKLVESASATGRNGKRSRYFLITTVLVGSLFFTALIVSLYAADFGLGNEQFDISTMLAPIAPDQPEPPPVQTPLRQNSSASELPNRTQNILRIDENPSVPDKISVIPSPFRARPIGRFTNLDRPDSDGVGTEIGPARNNTEGSGSSVPAAALTTERPPDPPPVIRPRTEAPKLPRSIGVVNGKATYLPKPPYPPAAVAVRAEGQVTVQVTIDEHGSVVASKALDGNPLLKPAAERAAWSARFTPTLLNNAPVKVTGVIVYKFTRN